MTAMTDWTVHLEFQEGTSSKFWRARVEGKSLYVNYGKIGTNGQTQVKDFGDPAAARAEYDKLVREKRKKGYHDAGPATSGAPSGHSGHNSGRNSEDDNTDDDHGDDRDDDDGDDDDDEPAPPPARKPAARPAARPAAAPPASPGHRLVLDAGGRKVETTLYLDGSTVRMDSRESYASPDAASKAFDRLKRLLGGEGYKSS